MSSQGGEPTEREAPAQWGDEVAVAEAVEDPAYAIASADAPALTRPRLYYGWIMLPVATVALICTSPGQTFGASAFNPYLRESLGISATQLSAAYGLGTFLAALPMGYVGALMDRYGLRVTMTVVAMLFGGVCILVSQVMGLVTLFLAFLLLRMLGQGALGLLSANTLPFWFDRKLGSVEGLRNMGMAGAIAVVPAINLALIHSVGWRWAYVVLGIGVWAIMLPLMALVFRNRPEELGQRKDGEWIEGDRTESDRAAAEADAANSFTLGEALRTRAIWFAGAGMALWSMSGTGVMFHIIPLLGSRGLTEAEAAGLFGAFAFSLALTYLIGGMLADRLPLNVLLSVAAAGLVVSMALVWNAATTQMVLMAGIAMGLSQGLNVAALGPLLPRYYGRAHLGKIRGSMTTVMVAASSVGPLLVGGCYDLFGGYGPIMLLLTLLPLPLVGLSLLATPPRRTGALGPRRGSVA
ncbi:MAG: MFS transporter [Phycisphaeraceae bacterium]